MTEEHSKLSGAPDVLRQAYDDASRTLRVLPKAFTGSTYVSLNADADGNLLTPATEATYATGTLAFGSVNGSGGSYVTLVTISGGAIIASLTLFNTTDQDMTYSFDASTIHGYLPARSSITTDYKSNQRKESSSVSVRYATTTVGAVGAAFGNAVT